MRILCLANSFKTGGRCLAGILLDENNTPILEHNRPVWIRPICDTDHGQVPKHLCEHFRLGDIIELNNTVNVGEGYQAENTSFDEKSLRKVGEYSSSITPFCENSFRFNLFGNRGGAVIKDQIDKINYSLSLIEVNKFEIVQRSYEGKEHPQIRMKFTFQGAEYDLPITDPAFLERLNKKPHILGDTDSIFLTLSLGVEHEGWYSKLVAAVIVPK